MVYINGITFSLNDLNIKKTNIDVDNCCKWFEVTILFFYVGAAVQYYVYLYVSNKYSSAIRLATTMKDSKYQNTIIEAGKSISLRFPTSSPAPVKITAFNSATNEQIKINGDDFVTVLPGRQLAIPTTLSITSSGKLICRYF